MSTRILARPRSQNSQLIWVKVYFFLTSRGKLLIASSSLDFDAHSHRMNANEISHQRYHNTTTYTCMLTIKSQASCWCCRSYFWVFLNWKICTYYFFEFWFWKNDDRVLLGIFCSPFFLTDEIKIWIIFLHFFPQKFTWSPWVWGV